MTNTKALEDIKHIRTLMERSVRFSSLSGISGILAGTYALIGAFAGYLYVYEESSILEYRKVYLLDNGVLDRLLTIAAIVLFASLITGYLFSRKKAKKQGRKLWDKSTRNVLASFGYPMVIGGIFIVIMIWRSYYGLVGPMTLITYGLSLYSASNFTLKEIRWLGIIETLLGLISAIFPGYGLIFWSLGFGLLHIVYGTAMYLKYER